MPAIYNMLNLEKFTDNVSLQYRNFLRALLKAHSYKKLLRYDRSQETLATIADDGHTIESSQPMGKIRTQNCVNPGTQIRGYHAISNIKTKERILISR